NVSVSLADVYQDFQNVVNTKFAAKYEGISMEKNLKRTTYAGLVDEHYLDQEVVLKGWVQKRRNLGNLIFIDLRDREGIVQLVFSQEFGPDALKIADSLRSEYVIEVVGKVVARDENAINPNMKTGKVEVEVSDVH